jgi:hypothetical protein
LSTKFFASRAEQYGETGFDGFRRQRFDTGSESEILRRDGQSD